MSLLSSEDWESKHSTIKNEVNHYILTDMTPNKEYIKHISDEQQKLRQQSPYKSMETLTKMADLTRMSLELYNLLRWSNIDTEEKWSIKPAWITDRYMAPEGHVTLLYKQPDDRRIRLFREGSEEPYIVEYKSKDHRELYARSMMFRRTSIGPDEEDDQDDNDNKPSEVVPDPEGKQLEELLCEV